MLVVCVWMVVVGVVVVYIVCVWRGGGIMSAILVVDICVYLCNIDIYLYISTCIYLYVYIYMSLSM